jgi:hypothetical protein
MSEVGKLAGIVGAGSLLNASYHVSTKTDPIPSLLGGFVYFVILAGLGAAMGRYDLVKTIAGVALFGMILYRGIPILNLINKFVTGIQTPPTKKK